MIPVYRRELPGRGTWNEHRNHGGQIGLHHGTISYSVTMQGRQFSPTVPRNFIAAIGLNIRVPSMRLLPETGGSMTTGPFTFTTFSAKTS